MVDGFARLNQFDIFPTGDPDRLRATQIKANLFPTNLDFIVLPYLALEPIDKFRRAAAKRAGVSEAGADEPIDVEIPADAPAPDGATREVAEAPQG